VVSGRARYTYSNRQPFGSGAANRDDRSPCSSTASISPGSTSRTKLAPTMSSAAVSLATTQPRSIRPSTSGRTPWASRAAYSVLSSMKTKLNAPRRPGSTSNAAASTERSGRLASNVVTSAVSDVARSASRSRSAISRASSAVLTRLPLCASAMVVPAVVARMVGWAFSQLEPPVVE
jgi:hypothetical protein